MSPGRARTPFFLSLLSNALLAASVALPLTLEIPTSVSTSEDAIYQPHNSTSSAPIPLLTPLNTTPTSPDTISSGFPIVPISGTDIYLQITYIGESCFATSLLERLISGAHDKIKEHLTWHPDDAVAPLPWFHGVYNKEWRDTIALRIRGNNGKMFTWQQLDWVLGGLSGYMEGEPVQLHPLNFGVNVVEEGIVAVGVLWYSQRPRLRGLRGGIEGSG